MINIIRNFYSISSTCIRTGNGETDYIKVTQGILQGEVLSLLLFVMFIIDLESFFIERGCRGLSINRISEVLVLGYADDLVFLSDTPVELSRKLKALHDYCVLNKLSVNVQKTKIVIFTRSSNSKVKNF